MTLTVEQIEDLTDQMLVRIGAMAGGLNLDDHDGFLLTHNFTMTMLAQLIDAIALHNNREDAAKKAFNAISNALDSFFDETGVIARKIEWRG